ncbi:MAG: hypothetical protein KGL35_21910 [Bradyrhizobium sp.]|nr:hypothetical protein [Bradyrhizobium sp.]
MVGRLHNYRHELFAVALAEGKSRADAMVAAGYPFHRGNQNRLAKMPDIVRRVEEIKRASEDIVDLRKLDRARILTELARVSAACEPLRAAIVAAGADALPDDQPVLHVTVRLEGALAKQLEMRLFDDRGALTALLRDENGACQPAHLDFSQAKPADFAVFERCLRALLVDRETSLNTEGTPS